jgi:hypothetical protein
VSSPRTPGKRLLLSAFPSSPPSPNPASSSVSAAREPPRFSGTTPGSRPAQITSGASKSTSCCAPKHSRY